MNRVPNLMDTENSLWPLSCFVRDGDKDVVLEVKCYIGLDVSFSKFIEIVKLIPYFAVLNQILSSIIGI